MSSTMNLRGAALLVTAIALLLLLTGLVPAAAAQQAAAADAEPAASAADDEASEPAAVDDDAADGEAVVDEGIEGDGEEAAGDDAAVDESVADDAVEGDEPAADASDDAAADDAEGDEPAADAVDEGPAADESGDDAVDGDESAAAAADGDDAATDGGDESALAEAAAAPDPEDIEVVEIDADAYCDLVEQLGDGIDDLDLAELNGGGGVDAAPGTVLPDVDSAAYRGLLEAIDAVLAGYPDGLLVNATYDGTVLVVTVVPDITECEGFGDLPLPEPVDDLDDVEVLVTVITQEDICEAIEEVEGEPMPPTDGSAVDPVDLEEVLDDLFDIRSGDQLDPDELADVTALGAEIDAVLANNPDSGMVSVSYDGAVLGIVLAPDATASLDCPDTVVAQPISDPAPGDDADAGDAGDAREALAVTGFDTPRQAGFGAVAVLLGAALLLAGRSRYRGAHVSR